MTRKDYILIAAAIADAASPDRPVAEYGRVHTARRIAAALQQDNPRFDHSRFLDACKVTS